LTPFSLKEKKSLRPERGETEGFSRKKGSVLSGRPSFTFEGERPEEI